jgi:ribosomal protein S18 acetylase RimI-like enzyme
MAPIRYSDGFGAAEFLALAQRVWPRPDYDAARAAAALARTANVGAWDGARLVGAVRLLTDGYFFATIPEILVDPDYQRRGIGRELMRRALAHAPRGKAFFGAQPGAVAFFERLEGCTRGLVGFVATAAPAGPASDDGAA